MRPGTWEFDTEFVTTETSDFYHATTECDWFRRGYRGGKVLPFPVGGVPHRWKPCEHCIAASPSWAESPSHSLGSFAA